MSDRKAAFFIPISSWKVDGKELHATSSGRKKGRKMALFKRADLKNQGFTDEQIEYIMTESGRSLSANYVLQSDVQSKIDAAVQAAQPAPVDVKTSKEYLDLMTERDMLRAIGGDDFQTVKPKFREQVFGMLDRGDDAKPVAEQLTGIREKYDEYFIQQEQPQPKPQFGSPDKGAMPKGNDSAVDALKTAWGFGPK